MKTAQVVSLIGSIFIISPIWFYLWYQVLVRVHATELMFFLFWVYVPAAILIGILNKIIEGGSK